jgi:acyl-CoA hydrolase
MFSREYKEKFRTPEEAVKVVKSGDWIDYMYFNGYPKALDKALAKRKDELYGVHIRSGISLPPFPEVPVSDPTMEHFQWAARQRSSCFLINTKCRWSKTWVFSISARIIALSITFSNSRILPGQV